ncbi:ABC transporter substrate-binding protein [Aquabacterium sp.]|uniref:ABC transporter substrate-binding protein n=1 Tax=Aquabacterium sp. TaxID=1872578 RepID=UPI003784A13D
MPAPRRQLLQAALALGIGATAGGQRAAAVPGRAELVLGQSVPLSGPFAGLGRQYRDGTRLALDEANAQGGIGGRPLRLVTLDDGYVAAQAAANARALIEQHQAIGLLNHMFTNTVRASWPVAREAGLPYVGPYTGHADFYRERHALLYLTRASFDDELARILDYLGTVGYARIGVAHYDNPVGLDFLRDAREGLARRQRPAPTVAAAMPIGGAAQAAATALAAQAPDALLLGVSGADAVALIRALQALGARPAYFARSLVGARQLHDSLGAAARGVVVSQLVPSPARSALPVIADYRRLLLQRQALQPARPDFVELEGFLNARLLLHALRTMSGEPSPAALAAALARVGRVDLGGHVLDFSAGRRVGTRYVELSMLRSDGSFAQ